jgi:hypothetical protein
MEKHEFTGNDHDLLVTIHTKLERAISDIGEIKNGTERRIVSLEETKANQTDLDMISNKVDWLQRIAYGGLGALGLIELYFNFKR